MTGIDVEAVWASLEPPRQGLTAHRHPNSGDVWLAIDDRGRRHMLVHVPDAEPGHALLSTHGLHAETVEISVEGGPMGVWADVVCVDSAMNRTFVTVARDLVAEAAAAGTPFEAVLRTLRTWRWFWGVDASLLSERAALGLFGEMWFLDRWAPFPHAVKSWHGPTGARHDFSSASISVEVKAASSHSAGPPRHRIATLDQLDDPVSGVLYLFSIQAIPEPSAGNTLDSIISRIRTRLSGEPDLLDSLDRRLSLAGWSPMSSGHQRTPYRVAAERLYSIRPGFPRLTRTSFVGGLPAGIEDVAYIVDLAACAEWLVATAPDNAVGLLRSLA